MGEKTGVVDIPAPSVHERRAMDPPSQLSHLELDEHRGRNYNEAYVTQFFFGAYFQASKEISAKNDACLRFWQYSHGQEAPLHKIIQQLRSNAVPEHSPYLVIEGDLVRVKLGKDPGAFRFCGRDDKELPLGCRAHLDLEPSRTPSRSNISLTGDQADDPEDSRSVDDALVLVEWNDSRKKAVRRSVMMLLGWVTDDRAERRGLLSEYAREWDAEALKSIPRIRRKFTLQ